jgi:glyoxylase-like metal-dependent hydrolase (beta-lactamase superfamily II)
MAGLAHQENGFWELTFPDATIWANRNEAERALAKELFYDEEKTEFLHFIANRASFELIDEGEGPFPGFRSEVIGGHTEFSLAWIFTLSHSRRQQTFLMAGDVIGSKGALLRKYAAKYDFDAEKGMQSREMLKKRALDEGLVLLAYHDVESPLMRLTNYDPKSGYDIKLLGHDFTWADYIEDQTLDDVEEAANERGLNG